MMDSMRLFGINIVSSPLMDGFRVPTKRLALKRWMKNRCYHARVQKKWNKRYGTQPAAIVLGPNAFMAPNTAFLSPKHFAMLTGIR